MKKNGKKRLSIGRGTLIGAGVAALIIIFMLNPTWLPFSDRTTSKIAELEKADVRPGEEETLTARANLASL